MKKIKLYVLIPDKGSGDYFSMKLQKHNIETEYEYHYIHPRVIDNKLTSSDDVVNDMNDIFKTFSDKTRSVVIACNTLQLWIPQIKEEYKKNVKIYTTFEACEWKFGNDEQKPLWLGTYPLVERTDKFPTLLSLGKPEVQRDVQELIWRIKMLWGDEIITAYDNVKKDSNLSKEQQNQKIEALKQKIVLSIKEMGIKKVILGCTELPMVFPNGEANGILWIDPAEVLAEYVKHQSVMILFAGGTISSVANADGALVGGHVFNLLEKLGENMPGAFKRLNITKSDIIYSGLSENTTTEILENIWKNILEALEAEPSRIVVTHGTDAMEQSAKFVANKMAELQLKTKTKVFFTGANLPPADPNTDAWDNLRLSINAKIPEGCEQVPVFIGFGGRVIPAQEVTKIYFGGQNHFVSVKSGEYRQFIDDYENKASYYKTELNKVIKHEPDQSGIMVYEVNKIRTDHNDFLKSVEENCPKAVIFKLYHSGTANTTDPKVSVAKLVERLTNKGIVSFGVTESGEPTNLHAYETSVALLNAGMVPLYNMLFDVALHKLYLLNAIRRNLTPDQIIREMINNYAGEIDDSQIIREDIDKITRK